MKIYNLVILFLTILFPVIINAQGRSTSQTQTKPSSANTLTKTSDSLKKAVSDVKTSFSTLFAGKRDTIKVLIENIDYDDANLSALKEGLKNLKGIKSVMMQYKSGNAIMEIPSKEQFTDLWDKLPPASKQAFKLEEVEGNNVTLQYKNANAAHQ